MMSFKRPPSYKLFVRQTTGNFALGDTRDKRQADLEFGFARKFLAPWLFS